MGHLRAHRWTVQKHTPGVAYLLTQRMRFEEWGMHSGVGGRPKTTRQQTRTNADGQLPASSRGFW